MGIGETWEDGQRYEAYVGRLSHLVADAFVGWLGAPTGGRWLDVGCGAGALSEAIVSGADPVAVDAIDRSPPFVEFARLRLPGIRASVGDAADLPYPDAAFDAVVSGLVLNFLPEPARGVAEMRRVTRPGGTVAAYVWDYAGGMDVIRVFWEAAAELDPAAAELDEGRRFPLCAPDRLEELFRSEGLADVSSRPIDAAAIYPSFDDYWRPFLGGQGPAPGYVSALDSGEREALRLALERRVPARADGTVELLARAWAVRSRRSS